MKSYLLGSLAMMLTVTMVGCNGGGGSGKGSSNSQQCEQLLSEESKLIEKIEKQGGITPEIIQACEELKTKYFGIKNCKDRDGEEVVVDESYCD